MIERVASTSPILHDTSIPSSTSIRKTTRSSITSLGKAQRCWIIKLISQICSSIIECFKALFFTPKSPPLTSPSIVYRNNLNKLQNDLLPLESPIAPQPSRTTDDAEKKKEGYAALELSAIDKKNIYTVFHTMAENSNHLWRLYTDATVKRLGTSINHIHPYKLLKELSTPRLKPDLKKITENSILRYVFITNLKKSFDRFSDKDLLLYLPDFAKEFGCTPSLLTPFLNSRNWNDLVLQLLQLQIVKV